MTSDNIYFSNHLLAWFDQAGRKDLPWQKKLTPYRVWISEIMLQQTQVLTVIPYYQRFMSTFPNLKTLAEASLDHVLQHWAGLGYYSRARNLHKTAVIIYQQYKGKFPKSVDELQQLPGIGRSTAGAIASIAMNIRAPILDGNVKRVLTRFAAIEGYPGEVNVSKELWQLADALTPEHRFGDYTQAIMDLGATVCTRKRPQCTECPLQDNCLAMSQGNQEKYPQSKPKKRIPTKALYFLLMRDAKQNILLEKRASLGIWGGLWSLPECTLIEEIENACRDKYYCEIKNYDLLPAFRHTFSHYHLDITPVLININKRYPCIMDDSSFLWYKPKQLSTIGVAAPVKRLLQQIINL